MSHEVKQKKTENLIRNEETIFDKNLERSVDRCFCDQATTKYFYLNKYTYQPTTKSTLIHSIIQQHFISSDGFMTVITPRR